MRRHRKSLRLALESEAIDEAYGGFSGFVGIQGVGSG